ncbi:MAG: CotH kinase family protein, partial [Candidatus Cellulosilyticum pullistercoris]|nr:CotH kinase family protein [Candidatus Cellulosilyticum pullistercoris]
MITTLILATGCASGSVKEEDTSVTQEVNGEQVSTGTEAAYKSKLFDTSYVHNINIEIDEEDWNDLLENASDQNFYSCNITIDGEEYSNVGIRAKGNSSLSQVVNSDSDRYSFKINFKKYSKEQNYYGLEKLNLNNIIQDATYMKDYLAYTMMGEFGVASPYVSYSYITINGEEWGLYLNVEEVEESFLERNYGADYGNLYKPETMEMNGDKGGKMPQGMKPGNLPEGFDSENMMQIPQGDNQEGIMQGPEASQTADTRGGFGGPGSENSLGADLKYTDDQYDSYANIFDYAETDITDNDKDRLIASLKQLNEGTNLDEVLDVDALLRYFVVHNFVDNYDSYTGTMLHNYYLYEQDGKLTILPWDYNLAFGAFGGMGGKNDKGNMLPPNSNAEQNNEATQNVEPAQMNKGQMMGEEVDATSMVNMAIDTPLSGAEEADRPMWSQLINNETYKAKYHDLFDEFLQNYIENGVIQDEINRVTEMISPYVQKDPTAFYTYEEFTKG